MYRKIFAIFKYRGYIYTTLIGYVGYKTYEKGTDGLKTVNEYVSTFENAISNVKFSVKDKLLLFKNMELKSLYYNYSLMFNAKLSEIFEDDFSAVYIPTNSLVDDKSFKSQEYEEKIAQLLKENELLRNSLKHFNRKNEKLSVVDLYSQLLDDLESLNKSDDILPKVVVVGDQSSGKTSVLEMIAQHRIFPRASGEMMTRSPVKVTLTNGPYFVAYFNDNKREYDLNLESDLKDLRAEVMKRMKPQNSATISSNVVSLTVKGPNLPKMILIDLPGIISTVTTEMNPNTKEAIINLIRRYLVQSNSIILCVQDGSIDAERSNVTDLVSSIDPMGKRTIFVLTKIDLAEKQSFNLEKLKKIMEGKIFPMRALGYYAVITGTGNNNDTIPNIKQYEEEFFANSQLLKHNYIKRDQVTTKNMSTAVSKLFWNLVRNTISQSYEEIKALRFNLETEWKNKYPKAPEMDRVELFEKSKGYIIDDISKLYTLPDTEWDIKIYNALWEGIKEKFISTTYLNYLKNMSAHSSSLDVQLRKLLDFDIPNSSLVASWHVIGDFLKHFLILEQPDTQLLKLREYIYKKLVNDHQWANRTLEDLIVIQHNDYLDNSMLSKAQWDEAIRFKQQTLKDILSKSMKPNTSWTKWFGKSDNDTKIRDDHYNLFQKELDSFVQTYGYQNLAKISTENLMNILVAQISKRNKFDYTPNADFKIVESLHKSLIFQESLTKLTQCSKMFYLYKSNKLQDNDNFCLDIIYFWKLQKVLLTSATFLRQQIINHELPMLMKQSKNVLDELVINKPQLETLLSGNQVILAEKLKSIRGIQEKMEQLIKQMNIERF